MKRVAFSDLKGTDYKDFCLSFGIDPKNANNFFVFQELYEANSIMKCGRCGRWGLSDVSDDRFPEVVKIKHCRTYEGDEFLCPKCGLEIDKEAGCEEL